MTTPEPSDGVSAAPSGCPHHAAQSTTDSPEAAGASTPSPAPSSATLPPAARSAPIVGWRANLLGFFRDPITTMQRLRAAHGEVVRLADAPHPPILFEEVESRPPTVFVFGAPQVKSVLTDNDRFGGGKVRGPKGTWLQASDRSIDQRHARQETSRRLRGAYLREHQGVVVDATQAMLERWTTLDRVHLPTEMEELCSEIALRVLFGRSAAEARGDAFGRASRELAHVLFSPASLIPIDLPGSPRRRLLELTRLAQRILSDEIAGKRGSDDDDVLATLAKIQDPSQRLADDELVFFAFGLYLAGHDVPAAGLVFALLLLSQHPDIAADLADEVERELGDAPPSFDDLDRLPLLDAVYRESLRVLCPALLVQRRVKADGAELGGHRLPPDSEVILSPFVSHHDADVFERPKAFSPTRWQSIRPTPYEYFPYSHGLHKCIGAAFAEIELKTVLAMVARAGRLQPPAGARIDFGYTIMLRPKFRATFRWQRDREFHRSQVELKGKIRELVDLPSV
ncbi:MAG: cytochrome P450 [Acidobacteriota bacterium]